MTARPSPAVMAQRVEAMDSLDFFPTPPWAVRALCDVLDLKGGSVWEPACGRGHMAKALAERFNIVRATDVHDYSMEPCIHQVQTSVSDFLLPWAAPRTIQTQGVDWVITNPPFRLAAEFIDRGRNVARKGVAMLVRTSFLEGQERCTRLFRQFPPAAVYQFSERVGMFSGRCVRVGSIDWIATAQKRLAKSEAKPITAATATSYCWLVWRPKDTDTRLRWIEPCRARLERPGDYDDQPEMIRALGLPMPAELTVVDAT